MSEIFVRASELPRRFGQLSQGGQTVFVTHHGRETHALMPIAEYRSLMEGGEDQGSAADDDHALADWLPLILILVDERRTIVRANRTAHAVARKAAGKLVGYSLLDAIPTLSQTIFEGYFHRTERTGEPCSFELPGMFEPDAWHRVETFRTNDAVAILARDITEDVRAHRLADAKKTMIDAIRAHGGIGHFWINVRGRIERADPAIANLLQLPVERLANVQLVDLVPASARVAMREAIERALAGGTTERLESEFLCNTGATVPAVCAIKDLRGPYGCEGAVMVVTRRL